MHRGIGFSDTYRRVRECERATNPPVRQEAASHPATPTHPRVSSLDARTADVLVSISYVRQWWGMDGRGLNSRPITIHPRLSPGSRPHREPSLVPTRRSSIIIRTGPTYLFLSPSLPPRLSQSPPLSLFLSQSPSCQRQPLRPFICLSSDQTAQSGLPVLLTPFFSDLPAILALSLLRLRKSTRRSSTWDRVRECRIDLRSQRAFSLS